MRLPVGYWEDAKNARYFARFAEKELHIGSLEDWYSVSIEEVREWGSLDGCPDVAGA